MGKASRLKRQSHQKQPDTITPPPEVAAAIDRISQNDREWFERHPGAQERIRVAATHEFWPNFDSVNVKYVIVRQVRPGFRLRIPILRFHRPRTERVQ